MKKLFSKNLYGEIEKRKRVSIRLLCSYLAIILAPAVAVLIIYITMENALLDIQKEKAQNLSKEAAITFDKEIEQVANVASYISGDGKLKAYMEDLDYTASPENFYKVYELAKSYPDYAVLNRFVKNIYILPMNASYFIQIPQVMPSNDRGMSMLDIVVDGTEYGELVENMYSKKDEGLVHISQKAEGDSFLALRGFAYGNPVVKKGVIVIEIQKKQIEKLLKSTLGTDEGVALLTNKEGSILSMYDHMGSEDKAKAESVSWKEYMGQKGWNNKHTVINQMPTGYNQWSVVTLIPEKELLTKIGAGKYVILMLCVVSFLIGIALCLWYWNKNQPVIRRYLNFTEKYPDKMMNEKESTNIWKNFGGVLEHVEDLWITVERQKQWVMEGVLRKILYGSYDSKEEVENAIKEAEISCPIEFPCYIVSLEIEKPINQDGDETTEHLETALRENIDALLPCAYQIVSMNALNYTLLIFTGEEQIDNKELKTIFEKINYAFYSRIPVYIFTGISEPANTILAISEEYEHVCRICSYAKYYKLRTPLLLVDLPRHQHIVFTVELEMQLEKTIKGGTKEQLKTLMGQVSENHIHVHGGLTFVHNLEMLRCILLRCLSKEHPDDEVKLLLKQINHVKAPEEIEKCIWSVWTYFADSRNVYQDEEGLKCQMEEKMEQEYASAEFNLAIMADYIGTQEKKLYRDFKKMYGVSFATYLEMLRIHHAQEFLKEGRAIYEVAMAVGYSSDYSFRRAFKRVVGLTPSDYQKMY